MAKFGQITHQVRKFLAWWVMRTRYLTYAVHHGSNSLLREFSILKSIFSFLDTILTKIELILPFLNQFANFVPFLARENGEYYTWSISASWLDGWVWVMFTRADWLVQRRENCSKRNISGRNWKCWGRILSHDGRSKYWKNDYSNLIVQQTHCNWQLLIALSNCSKL